MKYQMKPYKIITVVSANDAERRSMLRRAVIACGLAKVPSNAEHLIKESIDEVDYDSAYVVVTISGSTRNTTYAACTNLRPKGWPSLSAQRPCRPDTNG